MTRRTYYFVVSADIVEAESVAIVDAESVAIVVVSVDITAVESVVVSSVLGLLWQAAKVNVLPMNNKANTFFILSVTFRFSDANIVFSWQIQNIN